MDSFNDSWPHPDDGLCSRDNMAKAGFFYQGFSDHVKCFVCSLKLNDWNPQNDNPWLLHKQLSNKCPFARLAKEEKELTVEQWLDVYNTQIITLLDTKYQKLKEGVCS